VKPDDATGKKPDDGAAGGVKPPEYKTWAEYVEVHPEAQPLHQAEIAQQAQALERERANAIKASSDLRTLAKTADEATAAKLKELADAKDREIAALHKQASFAEQAVKLGCTELAEAWTVAQATGLSAADMKAHSVWGRLFAEPKKPDAKAGAGTRSASKSELSMDDRMRAALGGRR